MPRFAIPTASLLVTILYFPVLSLSATAPVLTGSPPTTARVGKVYSFQPSLNIAKSCSDCFFLITGTPPWASFSRSTGLLIGTPRAVGTWPGIKIRVRKGTLASYLPVFTITVKVATSASVQISGKPAAAATVGAFYRFRPTVTAPSGATLSYTVTNKPSWAQFSTTSGTLSGTPTTSNIATYANIVLKVTDGKTSAKLAAFKVVVSAATLGDAMLSWTRPTNNTDGTPLVNLSGYRIHYGTSASSLTHQFSVANANTLSASIENLSRGTWYFAVVAYNGSGIESALSRTATKTIH